MADIDRDRRIPPGVNMQISEKTLAGFISGVIRVKEIEKESTAETTTAIMDALVNLSDKVLASVDKMEARADERRRTDDIDEKLDDVVQVLSNLSLIQSRTLELLERLEEREMEELER